MPASSYIRQLREKIGHDLILIPSVTIVTFDEKGRILLARHSEGGLWVAPGGSIDPLEQPADAAVREMWEETGLLIEPSRILGVYGGSGFHWSYGNGDQVAYIMTVFEGRIISGALRSDENEILDLAYFSEEEIQNLPMPAWVKIVLSDIFSDSKTAHFQTSTWKPTDNSSP